MLVLKSANVNTLFPEVLFNLKLQGVLSGSRNGEVLKFPFPVTLCYERPGERVLFEPERDANPFFHLFESVWMLAGRNDVKFPATFASNILNFSDDGRTLHGAYGFRWREHFQDDQLDDIIDGLIENPSSRRMVLSMWDAYIDPPVGRVGGKDVPCNTHVYFNCRPGGKLDMTVCNRSNDIVWGALGANAVHMSILHEYVAQGAGLVMGRYYQMANDLHLYTGPHAKLMNLGGREIANPYTTIGIGSGPKLFGSPGDRLGFDADCVDFCSRPDQSFRTDFFTHVVAPMYRVWKLHKEGATDKAEILTESIHATDWQRACLEWLRRRRLS
jgi:hypothetical protein